ncbi:hypothetical protein ABT025_36325 [Streptomyces sp. NPDC002809]|uniref:hypothetical protein n=1 Tax=Streptomyces sp. NPDC002809 TaxID=3154433 RepID=UPI00332A21FC
MARSSRRTSHPSFSGSGGRAQAYYYGAQGDGSARLVAEHNTVIRRYCETGEGEDELLPLDDPPDA